MTFNVMVQDTAPLPAPQLREVQRTVSAAAIAATQQQHAGDQMHWMIQQRDYSLFCIIHQTSLKEQQQMADF